ncbi:MAG: serine/threonine protein kinase [Planctomycetaceae bacterium]|nr:serine/threonine protein kinase [Planctomycetaceae bacterium]
MWNIIIERIDRCVEQWETSAQPPNLEQFLDDLADEQAHRALRELIKIDMEYRWRHQCPGRYLEDYGDRHPMIKTEEGLWPLDLIQEELHLRQQNEDEILSDEFEERFPKQIEELRPLLETGGGRSTSLQLHKQPQKFDAGEAIDDFDLIMLLGEGSFAQVFLARQISMQRFVALKISAARGEEHKTLAQLDHPYIVRVFSQTVLEDRSLRLLYMQYHPGGTLKDFVDHIHIRPHEERNGVTLLEELDRMLDEKGAPVPLNSITRNQLAGYNWTQVVCWMGGRIAEALDYSHSKGVLHRDLKPANVLVADDGSPKLADFNISFSDQVEGASPVTYFGGSLAYMSPEQLEACHPAFDTQPDELDARSDIYSLGILLWELLCGERPFPDLAWALSGPQLLNEMLEDRRRSMHAGHLPPEVPPLVADVLIRTLEPDREQRISTGADLARQLDLCLDPEVQRILTPPGGTFRRLMSRFPSTTMLAIIAFSNLAMSALNIHYNSDEIVQLSQQNLFQLQVEGLNLFAYGVGLSVVWWMMRPLRLKIEQTADEDSEPEKWRRRRLLSLGYWCSGVTLGMWLICGVLFPLGLHLQAGEAVLTDYVHFFASHVINGSLAAAAIFFLVSDFSIEQLFPRVVKLKSTDPHSTRSLQRLDRAAQIILAGVICLPLVSVLLAFLLTRKNLEAFAVLALLGLIGVGCAYRWSLKLRRNSAALQTITGG